MTKFYTIQSGEYNKKTYAISRSKTKYTTQDDYFKLFPIFNVNKLTQSVTFKSSNFEPK